MTAVIESGERQNDALLLVTGDEFPIPLDTGQLTTYDHLWQRYANSEEGLHQAEQALRFSGRYGYDRMAMLSDLGPDADPLGHMDDVHRILQELLLTELQTRKTLGSLALPDVALCRFTAQVHDVGESTHPSFSNAVGDIPFGDKKPWQRKAEQDIRLQIFAKFWHDLPTSFLERADVIIMHQPETEREVVAHEHVEAAHTIGSYVTGIVGGKLAIQELERLELARMELGDMPENEAHRLVQLQRLGYDVTRATRATVEELGDSFNYAAMILEKHEETYENIGRQLAA